MSVPIRPGTKIGTFVLERVIGSGTFASVWRGHHSISNSLVAIKIIVKASITTEVAKTRLLREISLLKQMDHPFIAEFFQVIEDQEYYYLVMEYVENGNLLDYVNTNGRFSEDQARRYFSQLVSVLEYLHDKKKVAHRDLKCENVLLDRYNNIRLIDFGLSNVFTDAIPELSTACGSPAYAAPEMIVGNPYTIAADIWSSGILLFAIIAGHLPYDDDNVQRLLHKIVYNDIAFPSFMSNQLEDLLSKMLCKDPARRITLAKIKEHPWFSQTEYSILQNFVFSNMYNLGNGGSTTDESSSGDIDRDVINQMTSLGIACNDLVPALLNGAFTEKTALYRILLREKTTESLKDLMEKVQSAQQIAYKSPMKLQALPMVRPPTKAAPPMGPQSPVQRKAQPSPYGHRLSTPNAAPSIQNNNLTPGQRVLVSPVMNGAGRRLSRPVAVRKNMMNFASPPPTVPHELP